jgi:hypothetical protein
MPGSPDAARVTTSPEVFDEHYENHQLLLPDSPIYRRLKAMMPAAMEPQQATTESATLKELLASER